MASVARKRASYTRVAISLGPFAAGPGGLIAPGLAMTQFKLDPTRQFEVRLPYISGSRFVGRHSGLPAHRLLEEL